MQQQKPAKFITNRIFRETGFGNLHPLSIGRQKSLFEFCEQMGWVREDHLVECPLASREILEQYHSPSYLDAFESAAQSLKLDPSLGQNFGLATMECPIFEGIWDRASASVGGSILGAHCALNGHLVFHPAGGTHHGQKDRASGFCYFNDPVFAVRTFLENKCDRVLYVDIDAHHGDGVETAYLGHSQVVLFSIHEENKWPYTGTELQSENAINFAVPKGMNDSEFDAIIKRSLVHLIDFWKPHALVVTCGVDSLADDPLSGLALSNNAIWDCIRLLTRKISCSLVLGGGGYNPWTVVRCWAGVWATLANISIPNELPQAISQQLQTLECDLIEEEDIKSIWLSSMIDPPNRGEVRTEIEYMINKLDLNALHI